MNNDFWPLKLLRKLATAATVAPERACQATCRPPLVCMRCWVSARRPTARPSRPRTARSCCRTTRTRAARSTPSSASRRRTRCWATPSAAGSTTSSGPGSRCAPPWTCVCVRVGGVWMCWCARSCVGVGGGGGGGTRHALHRLCARAERRAGEHAQLDFLRLLCHSDPPRPTATHPAGECAPPPRTYLPAVLLCPPRRMLPIALMPSRRVMNGVACRPRRTPTHGPELAARLRLVGGGSPPTYGSHSRSTCRSCTLAAPRSSALTELVRPTLSSFPLLGTGCAAVPVPPSSPRRAAQSSATTAPAAGRGRGRCRTRSTARRCASSAAGRRRPLLCMADVILG